MSQTFQKVLTVLRDSMVCSGTTAVFEFLMHLNYAAVEYTKMLTSDWRAGVEPAATPLGLSLPSPRVSIWLANSG
jgi:hypothetical protein